MGTAEAQWSGRECQVEVGGRSVVEEGEEGAKFRGRDRNLSMIKLSHLAKLRELCHDDCNVHHVRALLGVVVRRAWLGLALPGLARVTVQRSPDGLLEI
ncbi:hypothetical protein O3P69_006169 [Scylla paramamosain]|uniref:Uncharacterized protein n=1 Tax=Scylla paramamosain TaxID=85552 RepID=A0AAW0U8N6_SCYPA